MYENETNPASRISVEDSIRTYEPAPVRRAEHAEGSYTRVVEQQTAKIPSSVFLVVSLSAMVASFVLEVAGNRRYSRFIGMWVGPLLTVGVYNKMVKTFGPR